MENQIILGVDPGTNIMGYGIIRNEGQKLYFVKADVLKMTTLHDHPTKLKTILETITTIVDEYKPDIMAIEAPFLGKNVQSMVKLGRAQGVAIAAALLKGVPVFEYPPTRIKQSITGNGSASKEQLAQMLTRLMKIDELPKYLDATDALGVAVCHFLQGNSLMAKTPTRNSWDSFLKQNADRIVK